MKNPITPSFLNFLAELSLNNNRDWFLSQKKRYESEVKAPFLTLVQLLLDQSRADMPDLPLEPKKCMFRINRDVRFSANKNPYKENVAAVINPGGSSNKTAPGFYFHLGCNDIFLGGGAYFLEKEQLNNVRHFMASYPEKLKAVLQNKDFVAHYGVLQGEKNKRLSPELMEAAQTEPLVFNKQFFFSANLQVEDCLAPDFPQTLLHYLQASVQMNRFLTEAVLTEA